MSTELLAREARLLVERLRLWTPARWAAAVGPQPGPSRADVVHHLARSYADLEGAAPVPLPRLVGGPTADPMADLVLPDQLAVAADDLVRSGPRNEVSVAATAHLLLHRSQLLGDEVPAGLAAALGVADVQAAGRAACTLPQAEVPGD